MSEGKPDLVVVMLPRDMVDTVAANAEGWQRMRGPERFQAACKRALLPSLPVDVCETLRTPHKELIEWECERIADWIEHVEKHGWEPEQS